MRLAALQERNPFLGANEGFLFAVCNSCELSDGIVISYVVAKEDFHALALQALKACKEFFFVKK